MPSQAAIDGIRDNGSGWKVVIRLPIKNIADKLGTFTNPVDFAVFVSENARLIIRRLNSITENKPWEDDLKNWIEEFEERFVFDYVCEDSDYMKAETNEYIGYLNELFDLFDYHRILCETSFHVMPVLSNSTSEP